ncbi:pyrimidine/purine nucleoside phosphorylase [Thiofilum flexile]|uniref:pyrimidine/purine nucleoside phosphorylase n=1 Tax=Thiofilum flexile TaxID=125627 RepID=UPI00037AA9BE
MSQFDNVSVAKTANIYFDGKCVSYTLQCADGSRKSVGVIFPASLTFNTGAPEVMELQKGHCRVKFSGKDQWHTYTAGQSFEVAGNSLFQIEVSGEPLHYVCHFG